MARGDLWSRPLDDIQNLPGIGQKLVKRVIEDLGDGDPGAALAIINRNPYRLGDVDGIGFKKCDRIADEAYGIGPDDERRHEAGNRFILQERGVLTEREFTSERSKLELRDAAHLESGVEIEDGLYWLPEELAAEKGLEAWMRALPQIDENVPLAELTETQRAACAAQGLDEFQTRAVQAILANRVLLLTGGAGVGKTHVVAAAIRCAILNRAQSRGMAFAGKAADRMREALAQYGIAAEASTIHKALGFKKKVFTLDVLEEQFIFVDESSMLPNWLLWAVVNRLAEGAHLILVGDWQQLPPIGHGTPFADLVAHRAPRVHLSKNYRQQDQQGILKMAEGVLHRHRPPISEIESCVDLVFGVDPANFESVFTDLIRRHGSTDFEAWQVITWKNEDVERLNLLAQTVINPGGFPLAEYPCWKLGRDIRGRPKVMAAICTGDKVLVIKNSSALDIFNGQTGRAVEMVMVPKKLQRRDPVTGFWEEVEGDVQPHLRIEITNRFVDVPEDELEKYLQLGYVITVHKAQGSDWPTVLLAQPGKVRDDTAKKFWYTSITRAKNQLVILSGLKPMAWWQNSSMNAPDQPSTLMKRLAQPAPANVTGDVCGRCEEQFEDCAACTGLSCHPDDLTDYRPEPGPEFAEIIAANGMAEPLLPSEWDEIKQFAAQQHAACAAVAVPGTVQTFVLGPMPWRVLRQQSSPVPGNDPHQAGDQTSPPPEQLERIRAEFRVLELGVW